MSIASVVSGAISYVNTGIKYVDSTYAQIKPIITSAKTIESLLSGTKRTSLPSVSTPTTVPPAPPSGPDTAQPGTNLGSYQPKISFGGIDPMTMGLYGLVVVLVLVLILKK